MALREPAAVFCVGCGRDKFLLTTSGACRADGEDVLGGIFVKCFGWSVLWHCEFTKTPSFFYMTVNGIESPRMNGGHERNVQETNNNLRIYDVDGNLSFDCARVA